MGAHHAPRSSSQATRLAGRGAFTAAAALALAGGTASLAFASEAPSVPTTHAIQGQVSDGAHKLAHASPRSITDSVNSHGTDLQDKASSAASTLKDKAPKDLPVSGMKSDAGHMASNTVNDVQHAATNWSAAAKGGLTPAEGAQQVKLMANDVQHAVDNGKNDVTHSSGAATEHAPALLGTSVLSFG